jgi:hypothetical protein
LELVRRTVKTHGVQRAGAEEGRESIPGDIPAWVLQLKACG